MHMTIVKSKFPEELAKAGFLLLTYGEVEFKAAEALYAALNDQEAAFRALFSKRGEERRIRTFEKLMRPAVAKHKLEDALEIVVEQFDNCREIRNRYAHCHWDHIGSSLSYFDMEAAVKQTEFSILLQQLPISASQLDEEFRYFAHCSQGLLFLEEEINLREGRSPGHCADYPTPRDVPNHS